MLRVNDYKNYYCNCQSGGSSAFFPVYAGSLVQRGGGLGALFSSLFRSVTPLLKTGVKSLAKPALKTTKNVVRDLTEGKSLKHSLKTHGTRAVKRLASDALKHITTEKKTSPPRKKRRKIKKHSDIFS